MATPKEDTIVSLDPAQPFWERFYMVAPLVVIGTTNEVGLTHLIADSFERKLVARQ